MGDDLSLCQLYMCYFPLTGPWVPVLSLNSHNIQHAEYVLLYPTTCVKLIFFPINHFKV